MYVHVRMYVCMYVHVCMYVCTVCTYCMCAYVCTCTCMYFCCTYLSTCVCTYVFMLYVHMYQYMLYTYLFTSLAQCSPDILGCDQGCGLDELNNNITCLCNPGYILTSDGTTCGGICVCM